MKWCEIKKIPEYTERIERWDRDEDADGEAMGEQIEKLVNNDHYLKEQFKSMTEPVTITLLAAGWSSIAPYVQTVDVPGLKATDTVQMISGVTKDTPAAAVKVWEKMASMIKAGETFDGRAVFYCHLKKPTDDFNIKLLGVSVNE